MKPKLIILQLLAMLLTASTFSQVGNYIYSAGTGNYLQLNGTGIIIVNNKDYPVLVPGNGDKGSLLLGLPFLFPYNGINYDSVTVNVNGWIALGTTTSINPLTGDLFNTNEPQNAIGAWWGDGHLNQNSNGTIRCGLTGTDVYTIQYDSVSGNGGTTANNNTTFKINYQVSLFGPASSNPGRIEILYGPNNNNAVNRSIGIKSVTGSVVSYKNGLNGNSSSTTLASTFPLNGTKYIFTPQSPIITGFSPTSVCTGNSVTITGFNFTSATSVTFNGVNASFTINTANQITAVVPAGSSTGKIAVISPSGTGVSAYDFIPMSPPVQPGIINGATNVCASSSPQTYGVTAVATATSYLWSYTGAGVSFAFITTIPVNTLTFDASATSGILSVTAKNDCGNSTPSTLNITAYLPFAIPAITGQSTVCAGNSSYIYSSSVTDATIYAWTFTGSGALINNGNTMQPSIDFASNATNGNLTVTVDNGVCSNTSDPFPLIVQKITTQPSAEVTYPGGPPAQFSAGISAGTAIYQWQSSPDQSTWTNVVNNTPNGITYTGTTTATLSVSPNSSVPGLSYYYRCIINTTSGCNFISNTGIFKCTPLNDLCSNTTTIMVDGAPQNGSLNNASCSAPFTSGNDVWYRFTPTCTAAHTISVYNFATGAGENIDWELYPGCPASSNGFLMKASGGTDPESKQTGLLTAGTTYYVRVMAVNTAAENSTFSINVSGNPPMFTLTNTGTPLASDIPKGTVDVPIYGFTIKPSGCAMATYSFTGITIHNTVSGTISTDLSNLRLFFDANGNGVIDLNESSISGAGKSYSNTLVFNNITSQSLLMPDSIYAYLLVADINGAAINGDKITCNASSADIVSSAMVIGTAIGNTMNISGNQRYWTGSSAWNDSKWSKTTSGTYNQPWINYGIASLEGTAGTMVLPNGTVNGQYQNVQQIKTVIDGYIINGPGVNPIKLSLLHLTYPAFINVGGTAATVLKIGSNNEQLLIGEDGIYKTGLGELSILSTLHTFNYFGDKYTMAGPITINGGMLTLGNKSSSISNPSRFLNNNNDIANNDTTSNPIIIGNGTLTIAAANSMNASLNYLKSVTVTGTASNIILNNTGTSAAAILCRPVIDTNVYSISNAVPLYLDGSLTISAENNTGTTASYIAFGQTVLSGNSVLVTTATTGADITNTASGKLTNISLGGTGNTSGVIIAAGLPMSDGGKNMTYLGGGNANGDGGYLSLNNTGNNTGQWTVGKADGTGAGYLVFNALSAMPDVSITVNKNSQLRINATGNTLITKLPVIRINGMGCYSQSAAGGLGALSLNNNANTTTSWGSNFEVNSTVQAIAVNGNSTNIFNLTGTISGSGGLIKTGSGTLILSGATQSNFTGLMQVKDGLLRLVRSSGNTLNPAASIDIISNTATLQIATLQTLQNLTLSSGNLVLDADLTINGKFTLVNGTISGLGHLKYANGTLIYAASNAQITTLTEWPVSNSPASVVFNNGTTTGVLLSSNKLLTGSMTVNGWLDWNGYSASGNGSFILNGLTQTASFNGSITINSTTIIATVSGVNIGMQLSGAGIPANTFVTYIDPFTGYITTNNAATATTANVQLTAGIRGGLKISSPSGIGGHVLLTGTKTYKAGANYYFTTPTSGSTINPAFPPNIQTYNPVWDITLNAGSGTKIILGTGSSVTVDHNLTLIKGILASGDNLVTFNNANGGVLQSPVTATNNTGVYTDSYICTCDATGIPAAPTFATDAFNRNAPYFDGTKGLRIKDVSGNSDIFFPLGADFTSPNRMVINMNSSASRDLTVMLGKGDIGNTPNARVNRIWYVHTGNPTPVHASMRLYFTKRDAAQYHYPNPAPGQQDEIETGFNFSTLGKVNLVQKDSMTASFINISQPYTSDELSWSSAAYGTEVYARYTLGVSKDNFGTGYNGIQYFTKLSVINGASGVVLPVTITNLRAYQQGSSVMLNWTCLNETNIDYYEIERAQDGRLFTVIATVAARNGGAANNTYLEADTKPYMGNNFYRIKVADKNGQVSYTNVVSLSIGEGNSGIAVYPNPVTNNRFTVALNNLAAGNYKLFVYDMSGKQIVNGQIQQHAGGSSTQTVVLPANAAADVYRVQIKGEKTTLTTSVFVNH